MTTARPPYSTTARPPYFGRSDDCCHTLSVTTESFTVRSLQKEKMGVYRLDHSKRGVDRTPVRTTANGQSNLFNLCESVSGVQALRD